MSDTNTRTFPYLISSITGSTKNPPTWQVVEPSQIQATISTMIENPAILWFDVYYINQAVVTHRKRLVVAIDEADPKTGALVANRKPFLPEAP